MSWSVPSFPCAGVTGQTVDAAIPRARTGVECRSAFSERIESKVLAPDNNDDDRVGSLVVWTRARNALVCVLPDAGLLPSAGRDVPVPTMGKAWSQRCGRGSVMPCQPWIDVQVWADTASGKRQLRLTHCSRISTALNVLLTICQGLV